MEFIKEYNRTSDEEKNKGGEKQRKEHKNG